MIIELSGATSGPVRTPYEQIAGGAAGASPRGSTYWRRVQSCAREHLISNILRWEPARRAAALDIGLLFHGCLETYYRAVQLEQQRVFQQSSPGQQAFHFLQRFRDAEGWADFYEMTSRMMDAYLERWRNNNDWEILAVEYTCGWTKETHPDVVSQLGFEITTRLDLLIRNHAYAGSSVVQHGEHKSAHSLDPLTVQGYSQDDQVLGQCFLGRHYLQPERYGLPAYQGAIVNITTKGKEPKCERIPVQPSDAQLAEWAAHKRYWYQQEQTYASASPAYPKNYTQCTRRFGRCQHFDFCRGNPMIDAATLMRADATNDLPPGYRKNPVVPEEG